MNITVCLKEHFLKLVDDGQTTDTQTDGPTLLGHIERLSRMTMLWLFIVITRKRVKPCFTHRNIVISAKSLQTGLSYLAEPINGSIVMCKVDDQNHNWLFIR